MPPVSILHRGMLNGCGPQKVDSINNQNPWLNYLVAYASFERYFFQTVLALRVLSGDSNKEVRASFEKNIEAFKN
jgi:hypothetical protein